VACSVGELVWSARATFAVAFVAVELGLALRIGLAFDFVACAIVIGEENAWMMERFALACFS